MPRITSFPSACQYQLFSKPYGLFVYTNGLGSTGTNFATRDPFYTKWNTLAGIAGLGPPVSAEQAVTSQAGTKATLQTFDRGAVFNITSGMLSGRIIGVSSVALGRAVDRSPPELSFSANSALNTASFTPDLSPERFSRYSAAEWPVPE